MLDEKLWWQSRTIWGVIVSALAKLAALAHYEISDENQAGLVEVVMLGVSFVGDALAWYARVKATRVIGGRS